MLERVQQVGRAAVFAVVASALVTACAEYDTALDPTDGPEVQMSAVSGNGSGQPQFHPNSQQYSNTSKPNATGRAGSATITARALIGKDGVTQLEVTTGTLDSSDPAPGNIDKVQVKPLAGGSKPMFTRNYNKLKAGGYFTEDYTELAAGVEVQVQSNVSGIDRNRTGVVTVRETVKMRPDLAVSDVNAPGQAYVDETFVVNALVSELNGDVGARANCVLYGDGAEMDRSDGIWVDAGDAVGCSFTASFSTTGTKTLTVKTESVVPGDWDTANNEAETTIEIVDQSAPLHGYAYGRDHEYDHRWAWGYRGQYPNFSYASRADGRQSFAYLYGSASEVVQFPFDVDATIETDGSLFRSLSLAGQTGYTSPYYSYFYTQFPDGQWLWLVSYPAWSHTRVQYGVQGWDVTYYSANFAWWTGSEIGVYTWNQYGQNVSGGLLPETLTTVDLDVTVTGSNGVRLTASPTLTFGAWQSYDYAYSYCYWYYYCYAADHEGRNRGAWTNF